MDMDIYEFCGNFFKEVANTESITGKALLYAFDDNGYAIDRCRIYIVPKRGYYRINVWYGKNVDSRLFSVCEKISYTENKREFKREFKLTRIQESNLIKLLSCISHIQYNETKATEKSVATAI